MAKVLIPVISAALLGIASVSTAAAGPWGAFQPQKSQGDDSAQGDNVRKGWGRGSHSDGESRNEKGSYSRGAYKGGSYTGGSHAGGSYSGGWSGGSSGGNGGGDNGGGGDGISRSAPGPILGLGLPALAVAGGYVFARRRAKKK